MKKYVYFFASIAIFALFSCKKENKISETKDTYPITQVLLKDTTYFMDYVCDIHSMQNIEIRNKIRGFLDKIYVDEGAYVQKGEILFKINSEGLQQEYLKSKAIVKSAIAEAKNAELEMQNVQKLYDKNIVSKIEFEKAKTKYEALLAKIDEANAHEEHSLLNIKHTTIKAPFEGVINRIPLKVGSLVDEGSLLTSLSNNKEVLAYFNVSEKDYFKLYNLKNYKESNNISLILANNEEHKFKGRIETIDGEFDNNTGNISFRARFANTDLLLKNGSSGKIRTTNKISNALLIPQKSTFEIQDKLYVYVVNSDNTIKARNIKITHKIPDYYILESGLNPEEKFVYEGFQSLKDGDKIKTKLISNIQINSQLKN